MGLKNLDIRNFVYESKLKYKDIAYELNITPEYLSWLLREELTYENHQRIMKAAYLLRERRNK